MNKKSFFRGFGTGVLFAAIILGISFAVRTSDSAVISRAKGLGMTFEDSGNKRAMTAATATPAPVVSSSPAAAKEEKKQENKEQAAQTQSAEPAQAKENPSPSPKPSKKETPTAKPDLDKEFDKKKKELEGETQDVKKKLTINDGDWADKVSSELESMGIIDDAAEFSKYLNDNGYSGVINSGTYEVSPSDDFHDLAEKITSNFG